MYPIPRTLSSGQTFYMKIILPPLWIGGFAFTTASLFLLPEFWHDASGGLPGPELKWFFLLAAVAGTLFIRWSCIRLKRVRIDDKALYISNYVTEIAVPLANVANVTELRWLSTHLITVGFHSETEFGPRVVFLPKVRWLGIWSPQPVPHPVVEEIRTAINRVTGRTPGGVAA